MVHIGLTLHAGLPSINSFLNFTLVGDTSLEEPRCPNPSQLLYSQPMPGGVLLTPVLAYALSPLAVCCQAL